MRKPAHWFAVELPPADQAHYRETAFSDTRAILRHWTIVAVVATLTLAASIIAAVGSHFSVFEKIVLAAVGAGVGALIVLGPIVYLATLATAPHRQRNRARAELRGLRTDPAAFATVYSGWFDAKRAALPRAGWRQVVGVFPSPGVSADTHAQARQAAERRDDEIEAIHARARTEYQEQFRAGMESALGDTAAVRNPRTIDDLGKLRVALQEAALRNRTPKDGLRSLSRDGRELRDRIPVDPTIEERRALEPSVDGFYERATREVTGCAPEFVSELEKVPIYHPADFAAVPFKGDPAPLRGYVEGLLDVIDRAIRET